MERSCERIPLLAILVSNSTCLEPHATYISDQKVYLKSLEIAHYSLKFAKTCGFHWLAPIYHRQRIDVITASSHDLSCIHIG